ncbi:hypothetical protein SK128_000545 [Halocaridina rubra]|uniref:Folliculin-interacting protein 2 n=1 Tax=Halocaridina rubra TaxID=373956 RepID=A0AAN8WN40_HALRR
MCHHCELLEMGMLGIGSVLLPLVTRVQRLQKKLHYQGKRMRDDINMGVGKEGTCISNMAMHSSCSVTQISKELSKKYSFNDNTLEMHSINNIPCSSHCGSSCGEGAPFRLQRDGIRVLLYRECDTRGRKLLYDSKTVVRVPIAESAASGVPSCKTMFKTGKYSTPSSSSMGVSSISVSHHVKKSSTSNIKSQTASSSSKSDTFAEITGGYGYQYQPHESDTKQLGELVFGTVALAYRGSCSKLHILKKPQRVLFSRASPAPRSYMRPSCTSSDQGIEDSSFSSSMSSLGEAVISRTESVDMPFGHGGPTWAVDMPQMLSTSHSEGDSGFGGPPSPYGSTCGSFLSPPSLPNTPFGTPSSRQGSGSSLKNSGSLNSLQRRFLRNVTTSLEALGREGEISEDPSPSSGHHSHRVTRLGLAVIIDVGEGQEMEMDKQVEDWLFLHSSVIEASLNKLQSSLDTAYLHPKTFASSAHQAVLQLQQDMLDLVIGQRLCRPVWLGLLGKTSTSERQALCTNLVDVLSTVLATFDTKQTNFFVSKLLTAVLTHHLGWVSTVAPGDSLPQSPSSTSSSRSGSYSGPSSASIYESSTCQTTWVERLSESHPYSAIWAQLCELSGAVGYPPRAARTLLVGSNTALLSQLLTILSYIIRCSQIVEQDLQPFVHGENPCPERQQLCFSRTSSVASVVTIVEGSQHFSQARRNSSAKLHRDSSIRRSWRVSRENRGSRHFPQDNRVITGDGSADVAFGNVVRPVSSEEVDASTADKGHSSLNQTLGKKDKEGTSKWMLNDGSEIVIPEEKKSEGKSTSNNPVQIETDVTKCLRTSKTSTNLALLTDDGNDCSPSESLPKLLCKTRSEEFYEPSCERLYPSLLDLDDHRETFGVVTLEPEIIHGKVQKLFRTTSKCNLSQEPVNHDLQSEKSSSENMYPSRTQIGWSDDVLKMTNNISSITNTSEASYSGSEIVCSGSANRNSILVTDFVPSKALSAQKPSFSSKSNQFDRKSPCKVIPAKDIEPEIEEGGKVLFLLGENERIEGLKKSTVGKLDSHVPSKNSEPNWISLGPNNTPTIGFERFENFAKSKRPEYVKRSVTPPSESLQSYIPSLPMPLDVRKVVRTWYVGRESARDLTVLGRENTIYPSISELKSTSKVDSISEFREPKQQDTSKTHRRRHSDPTNGCYVHKMPLQSSKSLKGVKEEQIVENQDYGEEKEHLADHAELISNLEKADTPKVDLDKWSEVAADSTVPPSTVSTDVISFPEEADMTQEERKNKTDTQPDIVHMPR